MSLDGPVDVLYRQTMASLQRVRVRGHAYWRLVESRRINGKPRPIVIAYLGKADDLLARLQGQETLRIKSRSHGAVAALHRIAESIDVVGTIDRHLARLGRRRAKTGKTATPGRRAGLSVGQSLMLAAIARACHAGSKRAFADWAATTTLEDLTGAPVADLTSQHFWDQMDQVPLEAVPAIEAELVQRVLERFSIPVDTVLYDATNFFTFIASTNPRAPLAARGHNKQNRHDLRQVSIALLCTRGDGIPLLHETYAGNVPDVRSFASVVPHIRDRLVQLGKELSALTIVFDRGNVSKANQALVDDAAIGFVASVNASSQRALIAEANAKLEPVTVGKDLIETYRTVRNVWGADRTVVVLVSDRLRDGQYRGILQHLTSTKKWLDRLAQTLSAGKQRRSRSQIERDIQARLMGRQHLSKVLRWELVGEGKKLELRYSVDEVALQKLHDDWLGRLVLVTNRSEWSVAEIVQAYRGQSDVEAVFAHLKDPLHVALHPQFHWTDHKLHLHVFICLLAYLLARLAHRRVKLDAAFDGSLERLLDLLENVRMNTVARPTGTKGRFRTTTQLEEQPDEMRRLLEALAIPT